MGVANRRAKGKWNSSEKIIQTRWDRKEKSEKEKQQRNPTHVNYAERPTIYTT